MRPYLRPIYGLIVALALAGCATTETAPTGIGVAVAEPPCSEGKAPKTRAYPADTLTGNEDIFQITTVLWADRKARRGYELEAQTFIEGCTKRAPGDTPAPVPPPSTAPAQPGLFQRFFGKP